MTSTTHVSSPHTMTAAELLSKTFSPPTWAVPGILPAGVSLFSAKPKMGKSWLAYGLCVAVASGGMALGTRPVEKGEALYLALEDNERRLRNRLETLLAGDTVPEGLHLATEWPGWNDEGVEELDAWLEEHPGARLVVIDTLKKVRPHTSGRRNVYDVDDEALSPLVPVAARHDVSILVIHHNNQMANPDDPFDAVSGSTGLTGAVDTILVMNRERGSADATLYVDGKDIEELAGLALEWSNELASWSIKGDAEEYRISPERRAVIEAIRASGQPSLPPRKVAEITDKSPEATRKLMRKMALDGQLSNDGGFYSLPIYGNYSIGGNSGNAGNYGNSVVIEGEETSTTEGSGNTGNPGNSAVTEVTRPSKDGNSSLPLTHAGNSTSVTEVTDGEKSRKELEEMLRELSIEFHEKNPNVWDHPDE